MDIKRRALAEAIGTFWLVLGGCGSAVISAGDPDGIGMLGVSIAFGLSLLVMACTIGRVSGCHVNPAVTIGLCVAGGFPARDIPAYVVAQVAGAIVAALLLLFVATGTPDYAVATNGLAENGYGELSPGGYSLVSGFISEFVLTAMFLMVIIAVTSKRAAPNLAPVAIGLTLVVIHLISIPITNTSVNPARSTGPALVVGGMALQQLWLFWVAPILGAAASGLLYRTLHLDADKEAARPPQTAVSH